MSSSGDKHIVKDHDLLERFVLSRVTPDERNAIDLHLRTCEHCRIGVLREREIAAGARRIGRDEMKERLKAKLLVSRSHEVPWLQIASAAAVIVVAAGLALYYQWFIPDRSLHEETKKELGQNIASPGEQAPGTPSGSENKVKSESITPPAMDKRTHSMKTSIAEDRLTPKDIQTRNAIPRTTSASKPDRRSVAGSKNKTDAKSEQAAASKVALAAAQESNEPQTFWVEGADLSKLQSPEETRLNIQKKWARPDANEKEKGPQRNDTTKGLKDTIPDFVLTQLRLSDAPTQYRTKKNDIAHRVIPTTILVRDRKLTMTLYLDPLLPDSDLKGARAWRVGSDSLIVSASYLRLGYRLPFSLDQVSLPATKK